MKYLNKSFSVPSAGVEQDKWDKIFGKKCKCGKIATEKFLDDYFCSDCRKNIKENWTE